MNLYASPKNVIEEVHVVNLIKIDVQALFATVNIVVIAVKIHAIHLLLKHTIIIFI